MSAIEQTWDGQPLYSVETQRELHAIAGQAHAIQHARGIIADLRNPRSTSSNAQVEGETDRALSAWEGEGGAIV